MLLRLAAGLLFLVATNAVALTVTVSAKAEGGGSPAIVGATNLPDGVELMVTLRRNASDFMAQDKAKVKDGVFRAGPFSQRGAPLNPGTYSVKVTMSLVALQPSSTWQILGKDGSKLQGPLVRNSKYGGKVVEYQTSIRVGDGESSSEKDKAARTQAGKDKHVWWLQSCKDLCNISQVQAKKNNEEFGVDQCYAKCAEGEPKGR